jgi:hypothetical protein
MARAKGKKKQGGCPMSQPNNQTEANQVQPESKPAGHLTHQLSGQRLKLIQAIPIRILYLLLVIRWILLLIRIMPLLLMIRWILLYRNHQP